MFHAAAQSPATEQEGVHHQSAGIDIEEDGAGEAVAAETVGDVDREALGGQALDFRRRAPYAGDVHLVGALGELGDAAGLGGLQRGDGDIEFQGGQEIREVRGGAGGAGAFGALGVEFAAAAVFVGDAGTVEGPYVSQKIGDFGRARERQGERLGCPGLGFLDFLGIVVHQDEGVQADFQFVGERGEVGGLVVPVDTLGDEVGEGQRHAWVGVEGGGNVLWVVLAAQGEEHAVGAQAGHELLQAAARGIEDDAFGAVLAADAGPQGVVAIEGDGLERRGDDGVDFAHDGGGERDEVEGCVGDVAEFVAVGIVNFRHGVECGDLLVGEQVDRG